MANSKKRKAERDARYVDRAAESAQSTRLYHETHFAEYWSSFVVQLIAVCQKYFNEISDICGHGLFLTHARITDIVSRFVAAVSLLWHEHADGWWTGKFSDKVSNLFPTSIHVVGYSIAASEHPLDVFFSRELYNAIRSLKGLPLAGHQHDDQQTLYGRVSCYNPDRPKNAQWLYRGVIDCHPTDSHLLSSVVGTCTSETAHTVVFFVYNKETMNDMPLGTVVRFNKKRSEQWVWDWASNESVKVVKISAINVAPVRPGPDVC